MPCVFRAFAGLLAPAASSERETTGEEAKAECEGGRLGDDGETEVVEADKILTAGKASADPDL